LLDSRAECTTGSRTLAGKGAAQNINIKIDRDNKRAAAIQIFRQFHYLKKKPHWDNHFWANGCCVDAVEIDAEMIRQYLKYQEKLEKNLELDFGRIVKSRQQLG